MEKKNGFTESNIDREGKRNKFFFLGPRNDWRKFLDKNISNYLTESQEAINFYYTVEEKSTGIKISFAIIYLIIVTLLLFISITIAIRFSSRFFRSINNLILASNAIGNGDLDIKVPELKTDRDLETLNKNFNLILDAGSRLLSNPVM